MKTKLKSSESLILFILLLTLANNGSAENALDNHPEFPSSNDQTSLVSINSAGTASGNAYSWDPKSSANGRFVAFTSFASDLAGVDTNDLADIYVRDLLTNKTTLASINTAGMSGGNDNAQFPVLSANGQVVAFYSTASDLVLNSIYDMSNIYVRDLKNNKTKLVTINGAGAASGGSDGYSALSANGQFVAFSSYANDLVANDANDSTDVFVRDLLANKTKLVSFNNMGTIAGNDVSEKPVLSATGQYVAFQSYASNLVPNDTNGSRMDIFVRDLFADITRLVSCNNAGTGSGNYESSAPVLSANGRFIAFSSLATDLAATNDTNNSLDVFVRDLVANKTELVSINKTGTDSANGGSGSIFSSSVFISANGRFVAFQSVASDLVKTNDNNGTLDVFVRDLVANKTKLVSINSKGKASGNSDSIVTALSDDGRFVAFQTYASDLVKNDTNNSQDVFVRDLVENKTTLVSADATRTASGNLDSYNPVLSADGKFVAFVSGATDLVTTNDTNNELPDVFVRPNR